MSAAIQRSAGFDAAFLLRRFGPGKPLFGSRFWLSPLAFAVLMTLSCGTPHATLDLTAPQIVTAGVPFTITVTAMYEGSRDTVINSYVLFSSTDSAATFPGAYRFTAADAGSITIHNGFVLRTPGPQTIKAWIYMAEGINGTATVTVSKSSATRSEVSCQAPRLAVSAAIRISQVGEQRR